MKKSLQTRNNEIKEMKSTNKEQNDALCDKSKAVQEVMRSCLYLDFENSELVGWILRDCCEI